MSRTEHLEFCKKHLNRKFESKQGIVCAQTNKIANFETSCEHYKLDESGQLYSLGEMTEDLREGKWNWYFEDGLKSSTANFKKDKKIGKENIQNQMPLEQQENRMSGFSIPILNYGLSFRKTTCRNYPIL